MALFRKKNREEDLDRELKAHIELEAEERQQEGSSPSEARYAARRAFGNVALAKESTREAWGWTALERLGQDLRFGTRLLLRSPGFTIVAVLTLALGIGGATAVFSVVDGLMRKPLPYANPDRLVRPATIVKRLDTDRATVAFADILDWKAQRDLFEAVSAYSPADDDITGADALPERLRGLRVDEDYFRVMGAVPFLGRPFTAQENLPGAGRVAVLSHGLWMRRFGGDEKILNRGIELNGVPCTVIGVMPKDSTWPEDAEIFRPLGLGGALPPDVLRRDNHVFQALARLGPGVPLEGAQARLTAMGARIAQTETNRADTNWKLHPLDEWIVGPALRRTVLVLLGAVLFVLLIACVNVANLLLARGAVREREVAIRSALGAGWTRLAVQFLVESLLLAAAGGIGGIVLGYWGLKGLIRFAPPGVPRLDQVGIDSAVFAFSAGLCLVTAILTGVLPAIRAARLAPAESFHEAGRGSSASLRSGRLRSLLVVSELALAIVLLTGAGLLVRSLGQLQQVDPGFPTRNLITMQVTLPNSRYAGPPQVASAFERIAEGIGRVPGVVHAVATSSLPLGGGGNYLGRVFLTEGQPEPPVSKDTQGQWSVIQPGYFRVMGIPIVEGRAFSDRDNQGSTPVIVISRSMARQMFPGQSPLGRRIRSWRDENLYREIVGVVADVRYWSQDQDIVNNVYVPHKQNSWRRLVLAVRTQGDPGALLKSLQTEIWSHDNRLSISEIRTMDEVVDLALARPRFSMFVLGIFALAGAVLAAIGIYGVMSYSVAQRRREIGIRMALGALRGDVLRMVARRALVLAGTGVICGVAGALALTGLMRTLLFGVSPTDARTYVAVSVLLIFVALVASYVPARRAARIDPVITLRYE